MKFTFLGTSAGAPTLERNVTGLALQSEATKSWSLIDCGEGTQHQLQRANYSLVQLRTVFITHIHGDHCYGLPGLISSASMAGRSKPLTIVAPSGIQEFIEATLQHTDVHLNYKLQFERVEQLQDYDANKGFTVNAIELSHRVPSFAYRIEESAVERNLDTAKLLADEIPRGPLWSQIKQCAQLQLEDGRVIQCANYILPPRPPRTIIVGGDNDNPALLREAAFDVNVLIHEATYSQAVSDKVGPGPQHSSAAQVAIFAQSAAVPNLVLTHFSARYQGVGKGSVAELAAEAAALYDGNLFLAADLCTFSLDKTGQLAVLPQQ